MSKLRVQQIEFPIFLYGIPSYNTHGLSMYNIY